MTTVAISDGYVAVDSQATGGNYLVRVQKLARLPDGGVVAGAGSWRQAYAGMQWVVNGERGDPPEIEGAEVVIVRPDGSIWIAEGQFPAFPILDRQYASGCGADMARLLMSQGHSPVEAVAEACEHDAMSSGPIFAMRVLPQADHGLEVYEVSKTKPKRGRK